MSGSWLETGIGIDMRGAVFQALCVKRMWNRLRVADRLEIAQHREVGPAECGRRYRQFLRKNGLKAPWTVVALPRSAVLLRMLQFPRAVEKELARAVAYQLDSLQPFEEASVYWDFSAWKPAARTGWKGLLASEPEAGLDRLDVVVAIAERTSVDETAEWFRQAGIGVSQFSVTAALLFAALAPRLSTASHSSPPFLLLNAEPEALELLGYAPGMALVSKEIPAPSGETDLAPAIERELERVRSELRIDPQQRLALILCGPELPPIATLRSLEDRFSLLPAEQLFSSVSTAAMEGFSPGEHTVTLAAAVAAADHRLPLSLNLLPAERRAYQSPLAHLPTYALAGLLAVLLIFSGFRGSIQDWQYHRYLQRETQVLRPQLAELENAQEKSRQAAERLAQVAGVKSSAAVPLEILSELTRLLPEDVWLQQFQYEGNSLALSGYASSASTLLPTLAASPYFESPQFTSNITSTPEGKEIFRIGVRLRNTPR